MTRDSDRWKRSDYQYGYTRRGPNPKSEARPHYFDSRIRDDPSAHRWGYLHVEKNIMEGAKANGFNHVFNDWIAQDYPVLGGSIDAFGGYLYPDNQPSDTEAATLLAKRTNPSSPMVNIPAFFAELKDLPHMFKLQGRNLLTKGASTNLLYKFGWAPLFGDIAKTIQFLRIAQKRFEDLKNHRDTGWDITKEVWRGSASSLNGEYVGAEIGDVGGVIFQPDRFSKVRVWGHVRWKSNWSLSDDETSYSDVVRSMLNLGTHYKGTNFQAAILAGWELLPWSWFGDWFANVQDNLYASMNTVGYSIDGPMHIMRHSIFETTYKPVIYSSPTFNVSVGKHKHEVKTRVEAGVGLDAKLPVLNAGQWSILASLAILRGRR